MICPSAGASSLGKLELDKLSARRKDVRILDAYRLAARLHAGQVDKAGRPYIEHLSRVFLLVGERGGDRDQQIASLLHDAIEDELTTEPELLEAGVPSGSVALVKALTKDPKASYAGYIRGLLGNPRALLIKHCDLDDNCDPERLKALDAATRTRLLTKYRRALSTIAEAAPGATAALTAT